MENIWIGDPDCDILNKELIKDDKVLVTCDDDNIGSAKVIENNCGVLQEEIIDPTINISYKIHIFILVTIKKI